MPFNITASGSEVQWLNDIGLFGKALVQARLTVSPSIVTARFPEQAVLKGVAPVVGRVVNSKVHPFNHPSLWWCIIHDQCSKVAVYI